MSRSGKYFKDGRITEYKKAVLCVEGVDDAHFVDRILCDLQAPDSDVQVVFTGGNSKIIPTLNNIKKSSQYIRGNVMRIAVITDADRNPSSTLSDLFSKIKNLSFPEPINESFVKYENNNRMFGFFLVPSLLENGAIEDLLFKTVQNNDHFRRVKTAFENITALSGANDFRSKRLMGSYLALTPGTSSGAGLAFKQDVFPIDNDALNPIKIFISKFIENL